MFSGLDLNQEGEVWTDSSESALGVNTLDLSAPLTMCWSHMVGAFSQNSVILIGLLMILPSESDLMY